MMNMSHSTTITDMGRLCGLRVRSGQIMVMVKVVVTVTVTVVVVITVIGMVMVRVRARVRVEGYSAGAHMMHSTSSGTAHRGR